MMRWSGDDSMSIWDQSRSNNQNLYIFWKMKKQKKEKNEEKNEFKVQDERMSSILANVHIKLPMTSRWEKIF